MKTSTDTVYRRDWRLNWFRNGVHTTTVPERVLKLAADMAIECSITVPAKKPHALKARERKRDGEPVSAPDGAVETPDDPAPDGTVNP